MVAVPLLAFRTDDTCTLRVVGFPRAVARIRGSGALYPDHGCGTRRWAATCSSGSPFVIHFGEPVAVGVCCRARVLVRNSLTGLTLSGIRPADIARHEHRAFYRRVVRKPAAHRGRILWRLHWRAHNPIPLVFGELRESYPFSRAEPPASALPTDIMVAIGPSTGLDFGRCGSPADRRGQCAESSLPPFSFPECNAAMAGFPSAAARWRSQSRFRPAAPGAFILSWLCPELPCQLSIDQPHGLLSFCCAGAGDRLVRSRDRHSNWNRWTRAAFAHFSVFQRTGIDGSWRLCTRRAHSAHEFNRGLCPRDARPCGGGFNQNSRCTRAADAVAISSSCISRRHHDFANCARRCDRAHGRSGPFHCP